MRTCGCGICRTDLHMIDGLAYRPSLPQSSVMSPPARRRARRRGDRLAVGGAVAPYLFEPAATAPPARAGDHAQCENNASILGVTRNGGFAEFFRVRADNLSLFPRRSALRRPDWCPAPPSPRFAPSPGGHAPGQRVAVIGAGAIGLLIVQFSSAKRRACRQPPRRARGEPRRRRRIGLLPPRRT